MAKVEIDIKSIYSVFRTQSGIIVREMPRPQERADNREELSLFSTMMRKVGFAKEKPQQTIEGASEEARTSETQ